jgi:Phytanoyl-CoA dioxygenase (PhyH)
VHRKRTRFAARVERVAAAIERRGVVATYRLYDLVLSNRSARRRYDSSRPPLDATQTGVLERLREEGYAVLPFAELIPDPEIWTELAADGDRFVAETHAALEAEAHGLESGLRRRTGKEFVIRKYSYGVEVGLDDPWLRLGVNHRLLDVANAYLGMWSKLEYIDLWYTPPTPGSERVSSQRWHRDFNDRHLLKAFIYLVDVDEEAGPFEYVPRSAPGGELGHLWPWQPLGQNYPPQDELTPKVADRAVTFAAARGTVILCNTSGFHRGGFATGKPRALATLTYSSPASLASLTEPNYDLADGSLDGSLDAQQRFALS